MVYDCTALGEERISGLGVPPSVCTYGIFYLVDLLQIKPSLRWLLSLRLPHFQDRRIHFGSGRNHEH